MTSGWRKGVRTVNKRLKRQGGEQSGESVTDKVLQAVFLAGSPCG